MSSRIYECRACSRVFTDKASEEADSSAECPKCGSISETQLFTKPIRLRRAPESQPPVRITKENPRVNLILQNVVMKQFGGAGASLRGNVRVKANGVRLSQNSTGLDMDDNAIWEGEGPLID